MIMMSINSDMVHIDQLTASFWNPHDTISSNAIPPNEISNNTLRYKALNKNDPLGNLQNEDCEGGSEASSILDLSNSS
jgi:hypothetical protein